VTTSTASELWRKQTQAQRLSNRTILRFEDLAEELQHELAAIMPEASIEKVYFVSADRNIEPQDKGMRYYNLRLLRTFRFTKENNLIWKWLQNHVQKFEVLFRFAAIVENRHNDDRYKRFREALRKDKGSSDEDTEKAHNLLVDAIAQLSYTGLLPSAFDQVIFRNGWKPLGPLIRTVSLERFTATIKANAVFGESSATSEACQLIVKDILQNQGGTFTPSDLEDLRDLYLNRFIDDFMQGNAPNANGTPDDHSPYVVYENGERKTTAAEGIFGFFAPVFDFETRGTQPAGTFQGWILITLPQENFSAQESKHSHGHLCHAFRLALRNFSRRISEEILREIVEKDWNDVSTPRDFTLQHYKHYGGWIGDSESTARFPTNRPSNPFLFFDSLQVGRHLAFEESLNAFCWVGANGELISHANSEEFDKITHIVVSSPGLAGLKNGESENLPMVLRKRSDTVIPNTHDDLQEYGLRVARSVREIFDAAKLREAERSAGRAAAAEESYAKTAHQLRKLTRHIHEGTSSGDLDALRRYFSLTFLHPKNFVGEETVRLAHNIYNGGEFGREFLKGNTLEALVRSAYRYASCLYPLLLKLHNAASVVGTKPRLRVEFANEKAWTSAIWSHRRAILVAKDDGEPLSKKDAEHLQCKAYYYIALVALWLNIMEHSPRGSVVCFHVDEKEQSMVIENIAVEAVREHGSTARSLGTSHTLEFYFRSCFPDKWIVGKVVFPEEPRDGVFTTRIPLPLRYLCHHS